MFHFSSLGAPAHGQARMTDSETRSLAERLHGLPVLFATALLLPAMAALPAGEPLSLARHLPLQALFETISSVAAFLVFVVGWMSYQRRAPIAVLLIAATFLGVALFGLGFLLSDQHTTEPEALFGASTAPLFWMAARLLAVLGVALAVLIPWKDRPTSPQTRSLLLSSLLGLVAGTFAVILFGREDLLSGLQSVVGVAAFQDGIHYFAVAIYLLSAGVLQFHRRSIPNIDTRSLSVAIAFIVLASISFTLQATTNDTFNLLGQVYKLFAYYYLFRAVVISGIEEPYRELASARARLRATLEALPDIIFELDRRGIIHQMHSRYPHLIAQPEDVRGRCLLDFLPESVQREYHKLLDDIDRNGRSGAYQYKLEADGETRDYEATGNLLRDPETPETRYIVIVQDITQRKRLDHELRIAAAAFESQESICITDEAHRTLRVNSAFTRITGFAEHEMIGGDPAMLLPEDDRAGFRQRMDERMEDRSRWRGEIRLRRKSGEVHSQLLLVTAVRGEQGRVRNFIYDYIDISALKKAETRIQQLALYDSLTGLGNRRLMEVRLARSIEQGHQSGHYGSLLLINLIQFKKVNDAMGFSAGDQLLIQVAQELRGIAGQDGNAFRQGADEFALIVETAAGDARSAASLVQATADRVFAALNRAFSISGEEYYNRCRIGATVFDGPSVDGAEVLGQAAIALHQVKADPDRIFSFFDPEMQQVVAQEQTLESELRRAIAEEQFLLHYQPKVNRDREIVGLEALIRWQHPTRGLLSPGDFVPAAERTGLITPIEKWTLEQAIAQLARWRDHDAQRNWSISVNVASSQFYRDEFEIHLDSLLDHYGVDARQLILEFTESTLLHDVHAARDRILRLAKRGVRFSIDDFGTGYSSLAYLGRLPVHELKIDRSFVKDLDREPYNAAIVRMVIEMANILGMQVVAEGVETEAQYRFLTQQGCELLQGYLFGHPVPVEEINDPADDQESVP
ncbi:EAL domain-containing protein [Wenzhouxiangella sediminis]|uniref:cyclic-guanylate-specific phosphodiesterase n=2 Tax=Wenzhouxiangella sediminis TaxID=1792836 RepID=A0A3E1K852_9GAMM|nr:EAL domain-containing protein [Wenzhouxiangella sediminis]